MWQARYGTRATPDPEHTPRTTLCDVPLADAPFAVRLALDPCTAEWQDTRSDAAGRTHRQAQRPSAVQGAVG